MNLQIQHNFFAELRRSLLIFGTLLVILLQCAGVMAASLPVPDAETFEKANRLYYGEKYAEAQKLYQQLYEKYPAYGALSYNLGNAYFRLGKIGRAILSYERALRREPRNRDFEKNLQHVNAGLAYRIEDKRNWYLKAAEISLKKLTEDEVGFLLALAYFLFVISFLIPLLWGKGLRFGVVQKAGTIIFLVMGLLYAAKRVEVRVIRDAIVMAPKAEVRFGPSDGDRVAFKLGEGLKVFVVDRREGWSRIFLTNGEDGWIKNSSIEEV